MEYLNQHDTNIELNYSPTATSGLRYFSLKIAKFSNFKAEWDSIYPMTKMLKIVFKLLITIVNDHQNEIGGNSYPDISPH